MILNPPRIFFYVAGVSLFCLSAGCGLGPWTSDHAQVDRFRHELALTNFRLQRTGFDEVKRVFADSRDLAAYSDLVHKFAGRGTSRLKDRLSTFDDIQIFLGRETFAVCLLKKTPPMLLCDTSETPYIDRIQTGLPLPEMKLNLERISGR